MKKISALFFAILSVLLLSISAAAEETTVGESNTVAEETTASEESTTAETTSEESTASEETTAEPEGIRHISGDVNGDNAVTADDARIILRHSVELDHIDKTYLPAGDIDCNSRISANDARLALRMSVSLEETVEHSFVSEVQSASNCTVHGILAYSCSICEKEGELELPLTGHSMKNSKYRMSTCKTEGYRIKKCEYCSYETKTIIEKTAHIWLPASKTKPKRCLVCDSFQVGWFEVDSLYYYFYKQGNEIVRAENCIVDGYYVDKDGVRCDDPVINSALKYINDHSSSKDTPVERLRACYNYLRSNYKYKTIFGVPDADDMSSCASKMLSQKRGNCYYYAATLAYIGRALGFDTRVVVGKVQGTYGDMVNHSYMEFYYNGQWYICDASQSLAHPKLDWFMLTVSNYHRRYNREDVYNMTVTDGKVIWE